MTVRDDQRRHPRLPSLCRVQIRDRFATWSCETVDVGPRGCLVLTPRGLTVGALLKLSISSERVEGPLDVAGQVVWTEKRPPFRAGVSFTGTGATSGASPARWFEALVAAEIGEAVRSGQRSAAFGKLNVYLGSPPALGPITAAEANVVCAVGEGAALADVLEADPESARALLARGSLTLARASAVAPARWANALSRKLDEPRPQALVVTADAEPARPPEFELVVAEPDEMSPHLHRLLEFAVDALLEGNVSSAERFLRRAQAVAPGDFTSRLVLRRIGAQRGGNARLAEIALTRLDGDVEAS